MKLLLFGGTFDPPHKAASATPASLRLTMCQCFAPLHPDLVVSDWEIGRGGKNYTIDTVRMLEERYPGAEIFLSVGSDMLTTFTQWREWQSLLEKQRFYAVFGIAARRFPCKTAQQRHASARARKIPGNHSAPPGKRHMGNPRKHRAVFLPDFLYATPNCG